MPPTLISRRTRVVLTLDLVFSLVAGLVLFALSSDTDAYFAWTIKVPLTAAFLGAGYLGAVVTLIPSYATKEWQRVRIIPVMGFTLTFVTLVVTLWHLDQFHLLTGSATARFAGWAWLAVYVLVPILLAAVFVAQERLAGRGGYTVTEPLVPLLRATFGVQAVVLGSLGLGLVVAPGTFDAIWPWPLPPLSAGAVGAWLLTLAVGSAWPLYDGDWGRLRAAIPGLGAYMALIVIAALRFPDPLDGGDWQERVFFAALVGLSLAGGTAAWQQERRRRGRTPRSRRPARETRRTRLRIASRRRRSRARRADR